MAYTIITQWRMLDEINGDIQKQSNTKSSKWWFYGTRNDLLNWLPKASEIADFDYLDSANTGLGKEWAGEKYIIESVRYTAMNRFEWSIDITAKNPVPETPSGGGSQDDKHDLASKNKIGTVMGTFTITDMMCGYQLVNGIVTPITGWVQATSCPFTVRPTTEQLNTSIPVATMSQIRYLKGPPEQHVVDWQNFKGIQTIKTYAGRAVQNEMGSVWDDEDVEWTEWKTAIMIAPRAYVWNVNWTGA